MAADGAKEETNDGEKVESSKEGNVETIFGYTLPRN